MKLKRFGRKKPYTEKGLERLPCFRCGKKPSTHQWSACSDNNLWRPICVDCDIKLNKMVLIFMRCPHAQKKIMEYKKLWR
jgi:hypothetical protein